MAISFKDKIAYVNKFADKSDEKLQKVIKLSVNIESPKLNLTDAQKDKIKSSLQTAFERIKKIEDEKGGSKGAGKKLKTPNLLQLAKQIKQKQGITFEQARTKAKQAFAAKKSGQANAIQDVLQDFKKKVGKIEYSRATTYVSNGVTRSTDIKRDMERPALKAGKRKVTTQGSTTNAYGTFKNKVGKVYYESRANRMDVNQPSKKRYPKLEDGGWVSKSEGWSIAEDFTKPTKNYFLYNQYTGARKGSFSTKKEAKEKMQKLGYYADGGKFGDGGYEPYIYYFYDEDGNEITFREIEEARSKAKERGVQKFRDDLGGEYFINYGDGGFVAVGEKDGYWTIMTKPTTKEKAQKMLDIGFLPKGEIGKVVTVEQAKEHKKVIGREYLADGGTLAGSLDVDNIGFGIMAEGGMTKHGLEQGDKIVNHFQNVVVVENEGKYFVVNLNMGKRWTDHEWFSDAKEANKLSKMAQGGMFKVGDKVSSSMFAEGVIESKKKMGDDTMYFVTYQSSENPNKNNSTVLRESEMTKIRKRKMAKGGKIQYNRGKK